MMVLTRAAVLLTLAATTIAQSSHETVIGVYIFHRHGDRTPKSLPPANLTDLGYAQVYERGTYYRSRYVSSDASSPIYGLNTDVVRQAQIAVTAPVDNVLQNSAAGFIQALYPPVGQSLGSQTLRNGSSIEAPMGGFQLIPINTVSTGSGSEDAGWLQDASGCANAKVSSNNYFSSESYMNLLNSTRGFYSNLDPVINGVFSAGNSTFKNAYTIYDYINVGEIHNQTIPSSDLLTNETLFQLRTLADQHEFGLAYNASDDARAIGGMQLAGEVLTYLNTTISNTSFAKRNNKLGIQFGAYSTFLSFFGLSNLTSVSEDFYGVDGYASSMVFELFTTADVAGKTPPAAADLQVRFLFYNGSLANSSQGDAPTAYPLFGQRDTAISWDSFVGNMSGFAVTNTKEWCVKCGNFTGTCAAYGPDGSGSGSDGGSSSSSGDDSSSSSSHHGSHMSLAVAGVIGAMATLAVILGAEALIMLLGGLRVVSKKRLAGGANGVPKA